MNTSFRPMLPGDVVQLGLQRSQIAEFEAFGESSLLAKGRALAEGGWTATYGGRIVCCGGLIEQHPHEAVLWIAVAGEICPAAAYSVARFGRRVVAASHYERIEAIVDADNARAMRLATSVGLAPVVALRKKGPARGTQMLLERVT